MEPEDRNRVTAGPPGDTAARDEQGGGAGDTAARDEQGGGSEDGTAALALLLAALPLLTWPTCSSEDAGASIGIWGLSCVAAVVGLGLGISVRRRTRSRVATAAVWFGVLAPIVSAVLGVWMGLKNLSFTHGRALRRRGQARVPDTAAGRPEWVAPMDPIAAPGAVAYGWRLNAATEAASVAAFAHLANELLAVGAPAPLVAKAFEDAQDEIRHAQLCYGIAAAIDGRPLGPGPFPAATWPRDTAPDVPAVAKECLVEACVLEAASALVAAALEARPDVPPAIRGVLSTIAVDEARHAEHGWEVLEWCVGQAPALRDGALTRALASLSPDRVTAPAADARHEAFGLAGPELWAACVRAAIDQATDRLAPLAGAGPRTAARTAAARAGHEQTTAPTDTSTGSAPLTNTVSSTAGCIGLGSNEDVEKHQRA
jgi:hypothetical protein